MEEVSAELAQKEVSLILPAELGRNGALKYNIFEEIIIKSPNIYRALPGLVASNADNPVRRYWREYETINSGGKPGVLWGIPILAAVLAKGDLQQLEDCRKAVLDGKPQEIRLHLKDQKTIGVTTAKEDLYLQRIRFSLIPPDVLAGEAAAGNLGKINIPIEDADLMPRNTFQDKIVIIGNPNPGFGDIHPTPIGKMAGMYVMANAINTLLIGPQISGAPLWLWICFDIFIILITACFFTFIPVVFMGYSRRQPSSPKGRSVFIPAPETVICWCFMMRIKKN
jgi:hypothetical protein